MRLPIDTLQIEEDPNLLRTRRSHVVDQMDAFPVEDLARLDIAVQELNHVYLQCLSLLSLSASRSGYAATLPCNGGSESPRMLTLVASPRSFMSSKYLGLSHAAMPLR